MPSNSNALGIRIAVDERYFLAGSLFFFEDYLSSTCDSCVLASSSDHFLSNFLFKSSKIKGIKQGECTCSGRLRQHSHKMIQQPEPHMLRPPAQRPHQVHRQASHPSARRVQQQRREQPPRLKDREAGLGFRTSRRRDSRRRRSVRGAQSSDGPPAQAVAQREAVLPREVAVGGRPGLGLVAPPEVVSETGPPRAELAGVDERADVVLRGKCRGRVPRPCCICGLRGFF